MSYGSYTYFTELILVFRILFLYFESYTELILIQSTRRYYRDITERILVLQNLFLYFGSYMCITELIHVFQILYMSYRAYTCLTDLILVLQNLFLSYGSYSCAKVSVGTISRNRSGSYHIQCHIRLIQIRTLVFRRYRSHQIHIPKQTELLVHIRVIFRLIQFLMLIAGLCLFGFPVGVSELISIQKYLYVLHRFIIRKYP